MVLACRNRFQNLTGKLAKGIENRKSLEGLRENTEKGSKRQCGASIYLYMFDH